ncbi:nucleotidyltransferase domain-containing protein [Halocella sp. SP3-1]|nr:nucleotidyltransferase domain-containing protein [Halocella sp. SP3-1]
MGNLKNEVIYLIPEDKINEVVERIAFNVNPDKIILFGSYAEGNPDDDSDLDILVVKDMNIPRYKRSREIRKYLRGIKVPIDLLVYSQDEIDEWKNNEHAFINKALKNGKVLYG